MSKKSTRGILLGLALSLAACGADEQCQDVPCKTGMKMYRYCGVAGKVQVRYEYNGLQCSCSIAAPNGCDECVGRVTTYCM